ncbi:MAG: radical SAM/SPASM domain-containing protein [Candidatus Glassbacteria bacterium]
MSDPQYAIAAGRRRFFSYLSYVRGEGRVYPETVSILVGYRCNLACSMCGQWGERGSFREMEGNIRAMELSARDVNSVVCQVADWRPAVTLFGGEPLLHREIVDMIQIVKRARLRCNIITNGTLLWKMAEDLVGSGIDEIIVSLDGPREVHDRIRGKPGTFGRVIRGVGLLNEEKKKAGKRRPVVNINTTIWEGNAERLHELIPVARRLEVSSVTFHHPIFIGKSDMRRHKQLLQELYGVCPSDFQGFVRDAPPRIDVDLLINEKDMISSMKNGVKVAFYPNYTDDEIRRYYSDLHYKPDSYKSRCLSPWMVLYIFPNGDVRPCLSLGVTFGNMHEDSIEAIIEGPAAKRFRKDLKERGMFPACSRCTELYRF